MLQLFKIFIHGNLNMNYSIMVIIGNDISGRLVKVIELWEKFACKNCLDISRIFRDNRYKRGSHAKSHGTWKVVHADMMKDMTEEQMKALGQQSGAPLRLFNLAFGEDNALNFQFSVLLLMILEDLLCRIPTTCATDATPAMDTASVKTEIIERSFCDFTSPDWGASRYLYD